MMLYENILYDPPKNGYNVFHDFDKGGRFLDKVRMYKSQFKYGYFTL